MSDYDDFRTFNEHMPMRPVESIPVKRQTMDDETRHAFRCRHGHIPPRDDPAWESNMIFVDADGNMVDSTGWNLGLKITGTAPEGAANLHALLRLCPDLACSCGRRFSDGRAVPNGDILNDPQHALATELHRDLMSCWLVCQEPDHDQHRFHEGHAIQLLAWLGEAGWLRRRPLARRRLIRARRREDRRRRTLLGVVSERQGDPTGDRGNW